MQLTETVKLYPNKYQTELIKATMSEYISTVNHLVLDAINGRAITKITTADVNAALPSALCNQCIRDAKSIIRKYNKVLRNSDTQVKLPVLKKMCCYINNQNFRINDDCINFPVIINGKSKRISVKTKMSERQKSIFSSSKLGTMRIVVKGHDLVAQIVYDTKEDAASSNDNVMGVDLGIKCPAVSYCPDGSIKFYGNGRKNKYIRRHYNNLRKRFQKAKKPKAVVKINNKEQRKNNHGLHTWSFYRLATFIEYKAKLAGIKVEYVDPAYTSQICPICGSVHHANDRNYTCRCGYQTHRDLLGAINICNSTEYIGNRYTA